MKTRFATLQRFRKYFRDDVEDFLKENAVYGQDNSKISDPSQLLHSYELEKLGMGLFGRIFKIKDTFWVMKEGRWDLSVDIFKGIRMPLPARLFEFFLKPFNYTFLPNEKEILKQYKEYLQFAEYFGYFQNDRHYFHPKRKEIFEKQKNIRDSLLMYKPHLEKKYNIRFDPKIDTVLRSSARYHNFLPKEYLLIGKSISPENKGKNTSFIFQEFIEGTMLRENPYKKMRKRHQKQLVLMCYLILLMHYQLQWIPDTRPRYFLFEAYNWLTKTDNIVVTKKDLIFIDTRWMWDTTSNIFKRGLIIPDLAIKRTKFTIQRLLRDMS